MDIRPALPADVPAIAALHVAAWRAAYRGLIPDPVLDGLSVATRTEQWRAALARGEPRLVVAADATGLEGWVASGSSRDAGADAGTGEIWALYVAPDRWGRGTGRALLAAAFAAFAADGRARATLWVLARNERAGRFYAAAGFTAVAGATKTASFGGVALDECRLEARVPRRVAARTERLVLRELDAADGADGAFVRRLVNEPSWLRYIGERNVRSDDDARRYIAEGPGASYVHHGFGLWLVVRADDGARLGICGLIRRDALADVDVGFAFLPEHWGKGYALESARAALADAAARGIHRVVGITDPDNAASIRVLERLGLAYEGDVTLHDERLRLHARAL